MAMIGRTTPSAIVGAYSRPCASQAPAPRLGNATQSLRSSQSSVRVAAVLQVHLHLYRRLGTMISSQLLTG